MKQLFLTLLFAFGVCSLFAQDVTRMDSLTQVLSRQADSIPALKEKVDISVSGTSLKEFLRAVAEMHDLNLSLDNIPPYQITNNFENVTIEELLVFVCSSYQLEIKFLKSIIILYPIEKPTSVAFEYNRRDDLISFHLAGDTLKHVAKAITDSTGYNLVLSQDCRDLVVHGFIKQLPFEIAMEQFGVSNGLVVEKKQDRVFHISPDVPETMAQVEGQTYNNQNERRGTRRVSSRRNNGYAGGGGFSFEKSPTQPDKLNVDAEGVSVIEAIKTVSKDLNKGYFFLNEPKGNLDCYLVNVSFDDFLNVALSSANPQFSYSIRDEVYVIGDPKNLDIYESHVFTFRNRSVEKVSESIPAAMKSDVEINEYPELNSLVLTGSEQRVNKLRSFLEQIDKPVANVLIEVMVVVINRGASLETGISAGIADSIPPTQGQVFPGLDMTLNSESINLFLDAIDRRGLINLGQVTPNFYATIKALEQASYLDLQSTPKLSTVNGHEANLIIGSSVYYLIETQNVTGGVNPIITRTPRYEKVEANLELKIKPFVSYNEDVTLNIAFESSDFIDPTVEGAPPGNSTRKFDSKIRIKNEEMIVVGGLEQESTSESSSGLPVIARIPVLKWIFGRNSRTSTTNKLLVFIKPTIVY
ncbi:type II secretion system protein GspD [Reichenbachiella ulvae]|uniref:Type IV pilus assembly protein PilQ n=1 Tax=Reichenbachiella ulvae TaxID=2980104 RepID=A0ABT3CV58_9BACT|nr:secretin N-terminal domain-containing protein [Reichenbachiella ulvae]MCV9387454.1 hypothetical protein [Reichenbachiella ulvae]